MQQALIILTEAARAKVGIIVRFDFTGSKTQSIYTVTTFLQKIRKENNLPKLIMRTSPEFPDKEIWIFRAENLPDKNGEFPSGARSLNIGDIL